MLSGAQLENEMLLGAKWERIWYLLSCPPGINGARLWDKKSLKIQFTVFAHGHWKFWLYKQFNTVLALLFFRGFFFPFDLFIRGSTQSMTLKRRKKPSSLNNWANLMVPHHQRGDVSRPFLTKPLPWFPSWFLLPRS